MLVWSLWDVQTIHDYTGVHRKFLYDLLKERLKEPNTNISHTELPKYEDHLKFIESEPYLFWSVVANHDAPEQCIGATYATDRYEIGIHIAARFRRQGYAKSVLQACFSANPDVKFLANINPNNPASIKLFEGFGFRHIQNTYKRN